MKQEIDNIIEVICLEDPVTTRMLTSLSLSSEFHSEEIPTVKTRDRKAAFRGRQGAGDASFRHDGVVRP
jgi:hypothetical protein